MFKKLLATAVLICTIPAMASARPDGNTVNYRLETWAQTAGGKITVNNVGQTSSHGNIFRNYTTNEVVTIDKAAFPGYVGNSSETLPVTLVAGELIGPTAFSTTRVITATFTRNAATTVSLTATTSGAGGTVTPGTVPNVFTGQALTAPITFRFIPQAGYKVAGITNAAAYAATTNPAIAAAQVGQSVNVTIPAGTVFNAAPATMVGTFSTTLAVASVPAPQTVLVGAALTLAGSGGSGSWTTVTKPAAGVAVSSSTNALTVNTSVAGKYQFEYRIGTGARSSAITTVFVVDSPAAAADQCATCHNSNGIGAGNDSNWANSDHMRLNVSCATCHTGANTGAHPGTVLAATCTPCHGATTPTANAHLAVPNKGNVNGSCINCHTVGLNAGAGFVQDNNGVRAITTEFTKWSHHVTGVTLNDAHCAACHLEGKVVGNAVVVDTAVHMSDAKTHLRNADTDADMPWDPAAPNHTTMDNYCMTCHDANGATSTMSVLIQDFINDNGLAAAGKTASATNPFGDTISNRYDKMQRPAVVDASSQFNTDNNSHHAVKGPRYSGMTRTAGTRQIASPATFANNSSALLQGKRSTIYDAGNFNALYVPLENAGGELAPRTGAATLGDDSTLHCGDCHTVGQFKPNATKNAAGIAVPTVIGAHGSNNEYLLRNTLGTDARHTQNAYTVAANVVTNTNPNAAMLVCFNCHSFNKYGSIFNANGNNGSHGGEYASAGRCNGPGNTIPFNGYTTGKATDGSQFVSRFDGPLTKYSTATTYVEQNPDFGNIFGMQCANCHNSGLGNGYGGIHGSANNTAWNNGTTVIQPNASVTGGAYIDGMGNTTKVIRFLPGLGNTMYVPGTLGGITGGSLVPAQAAPLPTYAYTTGGISNDTNWEQKVGNQTATTIIPTLGTPTGTVAAVGAGCYTLGTGAEAMNQRGPSVTGAGGPETEAFGTWGGCDDHNKTQAFGTSSVKRIVRPVTY